MTRPMPGPHEHPRPPWFYACTTRSGMWEEGDEHTRQSRRLTAAECAAEYWRAEADHTSTRNGEGVGWSSAAVTAALEHEVEVWHRFATRPHAHLNGDPND